MDNPGGSTAAYANTAHHSSAVGRSAASQSTKNIVVLGRDSPTTATLRFALTLCRNFYDQLPGWRRPAAPRRNSLPLRGPFSMPGRYRAPNAPVKDACQQALDVPAGPLRAAVPRGGRGRGRHVRVWGHGGQQCAKPGDVPLPVLLLPQVHPPRRLWAPARDATVLRRPVPPRKGGPPPSFSSPCFVRKCVRVSKPADVRCSPLVMMYCL